MIPILIQQAAAQAAKEVQQLANPGYLEVMFQKFTNLCLTAGKNILLAVIIYVVGRYLIKLLNKLLARTMVRRQMDATIQSFLKSLVSILLNILLIVTIVSTLGIETTSFAALLASAGVAIGMALSGNLQNLAGGLIILLFKPYRVGDTIEAQGVVGTVKEIQIFHTILTLADNKTVFIPNGAMSSGVVTNLSTNPLRRIDFTFGVDYGANVQTVEKVVRQVIADNKSIVSTPAPFIAVNALSASSVDIVIRVWADNKDYWDVYYGFNRAIYEAFNAAGINFPFPQQTLHIVKES